MLDGSGRIHFREAGIAIHIGLIFEKPGLGVAKNLLCGEPEASTERMDKGEKIAIRQGDTKMGYAVQTKQYDSYRINPVYVSPVHRLNEETSVKISLKLTTGYKLPRPIYEADEYVGQVKESQVE
jgi:deoxyribonuclease V